MEHVFSLTFYLFLRRTDMRTNLQISFQEKDAAKADARRANTRIMWDATKKVWY